MARKTVVRVVVYEGEEEWVDRVVAKSLPEANKSTPPFVFHVAGNTISIVEVKEIIGAFPNCMTKTHLVQAVSARVERMEQVKRKLKEATDGVE